MGTPLTRLYKQVAAEPSDIQGHLPRMVDLVAKLNAQAVIELGVRYGTSTVAWLYGLAATGGHLWSVDIVRQHRPIDVDHWTFVEGDDTDPAVLAQLPATVDIVFVDTNHRYEHTRREIELYAPRVRRGGALVFHDTDVEVFPDDHEPGSEPPWPVRRAVDEFVATSPRVTDVEEHHDFHGLTIVRLGG